MSIVSDGAGSAIRSDFGSEICCWSFLEYVRNWANEGNRLDEFGQGNTFDWLGTYIRTMEGMAKLEDLRVEDYNCTVCASIVSPHSALFLQIGDGLIVIRESTEGEYSWVCEPDNGEYDNQTFFINRSLPPDRIHVYSTFDGSLPRVGIEELAMMTDGVQTLALDKSTMAVSSKFMGPLFSALKEGEGQGEIENVSNRLELLFSSRVVRSRTDDDLSLILISNAAEM